MSIQRTQSIFTKLEVIDFISRLGMFEREYSPAAEAETQPHWLQLFPRELVEEIRLQNDIRIWRTQDDPRFLRHMLLEEVTEFWTAVENDFPAIEVSSEFGDVMYLAIKHEEKFGVIPKEVDDKIKEVFDLSTEAGLNPVLSALMKLIRNENKYNAILNNEDAFYEGRKVSRHLWQHMGGDKQFYRWYEQHADDIIAYKKYLEGYI